MRLAFLAIAIGSSAMLLSLPCRATSFSDALRHAAGVNVNLAAQVAKATHTPPKTNVVPARTPAPTSAQTVTVVTADERGKLLLSIEELSASSTKNEHKTSAIVLSFVIGALVLGASASIAGFLKAGMLAGVLSILATATVGANNTLPFRDEANNYKYVSAETNALLTRANLELQMTQEQYTQYANQLLRLATYGDDKTTSGSVENLTNLLEELHSASGNGS